MKNLSEKWKYIISYAFCCALGVLWHFVYKWLNFLPIKFLFTSDESIFEHLKLLFFPVIFTAMLEARIFKRNFKNLVLCRNLAAVISSIILISIFVIYTSLNHDKPILWLDIILYFITVGICYLISYHLYKRGYDNPKIIFASYIVLILMLFFFTECTYSKPDGYLFRDYKH